MVLTVKCLKLKWLSLVQLIYLWKKVSDLDAKYPPISRTIPALIVTPNHLHLVIIELPLVQAN